MKKNHVTLKEIPTFAWFFHFRSLLNESQRHVYDIYKRIYAEMLFRWNLLVPRAKVLKYLSANTDVYRDVEYVTECTTCARVTRAPLCKECRKALLNCTLCRLPVKGLANACLNCSHGGHTEHMRQWFSVNIFPTTKNYSKIVNSNILHFRTMKNVHMDVAAAVCNIFKKFSCKK